MKTAKPALVTPKLTAPKLTAPKLSGPKLTLGGVMGGAKKKPYGKA